jgi:hypothetical protein
MSISLDANMVLVRGEFEYLALIVVESRWIALCVRNGERAAKSCSGP